MFLCSRWIKGEFNVISISLFLRLFTPVFVSAPHGSTWFTWYCLIWALERENAASFTHLPSNKKKSSTIKYHRSVCVSPEITHHYTSPAERICSCGWWLNTIVKSSTSAQAIGAKSALCSVWKPLLCLSLSSQHRSIVHVFKRSLFLLSDE